jgi:hypothetical protein
LVLAFTSIVDTVPPSKLVTKAVARHSLRAGTADEHHNPTNPPEPSHRRTVTGDMA